MSNYDLLVNKLDRFIRKYYLNQIIRGTLYSTGLILALFLLFNFLEYQYYFDPLVRKIFFFSFIAASLISLVYWVINPLMSTFSLGRRITHEQAADIIGNHFGSVQDKLLNILQLKKQSNHLADTSLIEASINQKTESIKIVPFKKAIDLGKNRKNLKYALPPFLLLIILLTAAPSLIKDPTYRIINNDKTFEKAAPFAFKINKENLDVVQYEDFTLSTTVEGQVLPEEVYIDVDNFQYRMKKVDNDKFEYTFKNVQKNVNFQMYAGKVRSSKHNLNVLLKPNLAGFDVALDYPSYINRKDEKLTNIGDLLIPQGTRVSWDFNALNTEDISLAFQSANKNFNAERKSDSRFVFEKRILNDDIYKIFFANRQVPNPDSVSYTINVIPDLTPEIAVEKFQDSLEAHVLYFVGNASDDYGLVNLNFNYTINNAYGIEKEQRTIPVINPSEREVQYDYTFDINTLNLQPGDKVNFFFEVFDNDAVNGSKSAKTRVMNFEKPTVEQFEEKEDANEDDIKDSLEESLKESQKIREELRKLREKMLQKQEPDWEDRKELEELLERQKKLEDEIRKAKEKFDENLKNQDEFSQRSEEIKEKQEKMQEMFNEMLDDESLELMQKIEDLLEELNKEDMIQMMEDFNMDDQKMEKNLDRLNELFKQLEMEKEITDQIEKLEQLAEEQEKLAEETEKSEKSQDELKKEQEDINKAFEEIKEKMEELEEKNEELEYPKDLGEDTEEQMEDINDDLQESQEQLQQNQNKNASQKQKSASQKMKNMAGNLQSSMQSGEMEQMQEDMQALRQLLENLVNLSFDQEDLIDDIKRTQINTPRYVERLQQQFKLKDDFRLIEDSLQALSKRVDQIASFVTETVVDVKSNMNSSIEQLEERRKPQAEENQRQAMKGVNDLALMLSESMDQMQQQMAGMMAGNQMCNKPGGNGGKTGQVPIDKITEGQKGLSEQLKKMMEEKGKNGQDGKGGTSAKDFAEAAARQAALRKALEELQQDKMEQGQGSQALQEIIDEMNKNEIDLVNKRLDNELLQRQQSIETRLLEAEKAERQREFDNKRKGETGIDIKKEMPASIQKYLKEREAEIEMYKKVSPALRPYYKQLVDEYYRALKKQ